MSVLVRQTSVWGSWDNWKKVGDQVEMTVHLNKMSFRVTGSVVHIPSVAVGARKKLLWDGRTVHENVRRFTDTSPGTDRGPEHNSSMSALSTEIAR